MTVLSIDSESREDEDEDEREDEERTVKVGYCEDGRLARPQRSW